MARTTGKPDPFNPMIPSVEEEVPVVVPTVDELMRPPVLPSRLQPLPPPIQRDKDGPFGPVPIIPPPPPPRFIPPDNLAAVGGLAERYVALKGGWPRPARNPLPLGGTFANGAAPISYLPVAAQRVPRGLPAMLAEVSGFDPSNPEAPPAGGLPSLIQDYLATIKME